jgi:hypothetical protein
VKVAIVKISHRAGTLKSIYVYEMRDDGWFRGGPEREPSWKGQWYAPKNLVQLVEADAPECKSYDYNGIEPGTLVEYWGDEQGIVVSRKGAKYMVLPNGGSRPIQVDWGNLVPVLVPDANDATG